MAWTTTNLLIQIVAGFVGAHLTSTAMHELHFGWIGHSIVGLIAGAFSGYFLQTIVLTVVTASGSLNEPRPADVVMIEALTGAVVGGIAMAAVGMLFQRDGKAGE